MNKISDEKIPPSRLHRFLRGLLILIALCSSIAYAYCSSRHGIYAVPKLKLSIPYELIALFAPGFGLISLVFAALIEYHQRSHSWSIALMRTFIRFAWIAVILVLLAGWIWAVNVW